MFSSMQPSLRARLLPRFPANVVAGNGISIEKAGLTYIFSATPLAGVPIDSLEDIPTDKLLGRDTSGDGPVEQIGVAGGLVLTGAKSLEMNAAQRTRIIGVNAFAQGSSLAAGQQSDSYFPAPCTIVGFVLLADPTGSVVLDLWKTAFGAFPPSNANSICAAAKPTIVSGNKYLDNTLSGWSVNIAAGDVIRFNIDSVSVITRLFAGLIVRVV